MSWKVMTPAEVCDLMDFWIAAPWPLTQEETQKLAVERFGWTIEVENGTPYLMNTVSNFTFTDVMTTDSRGRMMHLTLDISDTIREVTEESTAFLGDAFTLMVREGSSRWGDPKNLKVKDTVSARWDVEGGARVTFNFAPKGLSARFETPQGAEVERKLGDR
ncbi:DUF6301 family protein [Microbacterium hydrocarbonoxydans]|uniref:Uncharacterized protein n=1 Tax=Microbacterium hydrocarbonoxydans TaxID=273678 RepID=A0A1H4QRU6_9MICO|nr:DUF6301 family protein [Microbacterium hydrocarbonoxydans]SEC22194.1 hypothetical protein SAMN04489807_3179 [Microbacterium hydrocarbonoxydans]